METRIYLVSGFGEDEMGAEKRLVEAGSAAQAIRHVVKQKYTAKAATTREVAELMTKKVSVEKATTDMAPEAFTAECP